MTLTVELALLLLFVGCSAWCCSPPTGAVERRIERGLKPGDPQERVEAFLEEQGWSCGYDDFRNLYRANLRELSRCDRLSQAHVYPYLDDERRFARAKVTVVYTFI